MPGFTMTAMLLLSAGSTALSLYGQKKQADAAKKAGKAGRESAEDAASLSEWNANVADIQAKDAITRGQEEEQKFRTSVRGMVGSQRAGFAGAGIDVGFGSAADVQADAAFLGELDALTIRTNAAREAWGIKVQAEDLRRRAAIQRKEGAQLEAAGNEQAGAARWGMATTLLTGGATLLQSRYGYGRGKGA